MATIAELMIKLGVMNEASAGLKSFEKDADSAGEHTKTFSGSVGEAKESIVGHLGKIVAAAGIAGAAFEGGEFLKGGIEAAEGLQKANESLETAITKTGGSAETLMPKFQATAKSAAEFGISQVDATKALSQAVLMTGNAGAGQRAYQEAILLSKGAHISFTSALRATAKGQDGVTSGLTRYGVVLKKGATGVQQLAAIQKVWGGQAAANTLDSDKLTAKFQNMQAALGTFLLPYFLKFTTYMGDVIDGMMSLAGWVGKNSDVIAPLAAAIGAVVAAFVIWRAVTAAWTAATELATAAQVALDAAMDANPIGLVILALIALAAGLAVLWVKCDGFRNAVEGAWTMLRNTTEAVWGAIKTFLTTLWTETVGSITRTLDTLKSTITGAWDSVKSMATSVWNSIKSFLVAWWPELVGALAGPIGILVALIVTHWSTIKADATAAWNAVRGIITGAVSGVEGAVSSGFSAAANAVRGAVNGIRSAVSTVFDALGGIVQAAVGGVEAGVGALKSAFQPILDVLNSIMGMAGSAGSAIDNVMGKLSSVGGAVGKAEGLLHHIPGFATGVQNFAGGLAVVGENGPELVNLPGGSSVHTNAESGRMLQGAGSSTGDDGGDIVLVLDGDVLARHNRRALQRTGVRNAGIAFGGAS